MRVEVFWNLHQDLYSVVALEGHDKGRVVTHAHKVVLWNAEFIVQPAGRDRVRREKRKNVHAFVRGEMGRIHVGDGSWRFSDSETGKALLADIARCADPFSLVDTGLDRQATYNPYRDDTFVWQNAPNESVADDCTYSVLLDSGIGAEGRRRPSVRVREAVKKTLKDCRRLPIR